MKKESERKAILGIAGAIGGVAAYGLLAGIPLVGPLAILAVAATGVLAGWALDYRTRANENVENQKNTVPTPPRYVIEEDDDTDEEQDISSLINQILPSQKTNASTCSSSKQKQDGKDDGKSLSDILGALEDDEIPIIVSDDNTDEPIESE